MSEIVTLEGDEIVIRIKKEGIEGFAFQGFNYAGMECDSQFEKIDKELLFKELVSELLSEEEDGTTLVHSMMDSAVINASDKGSEALSVLDE